jgi:pimeloyl-ACP methyl ester carboxylesterase
MGKWIAWSALVLLLSSGCQTAGTDSQVPRVRQAHVGTIDLAYVEQGRGTPVVFVHGSAGDWRVWENQRKAIAERFRFIAYSRRYHAPNPWPGDGKDYGLAVHAEDLAQFLKSLSSGPVHLVGSSYGAQVALITAIEHPELVRTLTVGEPGLGNLIAGTPEGREVLAEMGKSIAAVRAALKAGDSVRAAENLVDAALGESGAARRLPASQRTILEDNARTVGLQMNGSRVTVTCDQLRAIKAPVLVLGGDRSPRFFSMTNDALVRCLPPGTSRVTIPEARHLVHSMNPTAYNAALLDFLARH